MEITLLTLGQVARAIGRGVILYAAEKWDTVTPLELLHLGDTEGDITVNPQSEVAGFTLPEHTGPAMHGAVHTGDNPTIEFPMFLADPDLMAIISPSGDANMGRSLRVPVTERTLVIIPEEVFIGEDGDGKPARLELAFAGGVWTLGGNPLTPAQEEAMARSIWLWRGHFARPSRRFIGAAGEESKNIETVTFQVMHHEDMPEGHKLATLGDPTNSDIDLDGMS